MYMYIHVIYMYVSTLYICTVHTVHVYMYIYLHSTCICTVYCIHITHYMFINIHAGIFLEKNLSGGKLMFQENEGSGLEVGAKIHNTNVCTLRALLQHNYVAG